jgi:hypothetical protein
VKEAPLGRAAFLLARIGVRSCADHRSAAVTSQAIVSPITFLPR